MSHIFDALLKSESERRSSPAPAPANITELLRRAERAERQAASQRKQQATRKRQSIQEQQPIQDQQPTEKHQLTRELPGPRRNGSDTMTAFSATETPALPVEHVSPQSPAILEEPHSLLDHCRSISVPVTADSRLVVHTEKDSAATEAFRLLSVRLRHIRKDRTLRKVLITSTVPSEGKSTIAANLACALATSRDEKVLLLEADIRRPSLTEAFRLSDHLGLCDWLQNKSTLLEGIYRLDGPGFWILPAGRVAANPLALLQSPRFPLALDELQLWFDWIIIDTPPILPLADTSVVSKMADGILLVTRRGKTEKKLMERGIEAIEKSKLLGAVLNSSNKHHKDYYYYGSYPGASSPKTVSVS